MSTEAPKIRIEQTVAILIDGNNIERSLHSLLKSENAMLNFDILIPKLLDDRGLSRLIYFREGRSISNKLAERLHDHYHGSVVPCHKSADIPLSIKATQIAPKVDTIIIMSGDSDYVELVRHLQGSGVRVEIAAVKETTADILIQEADLFVPISKEDCFIFSTKPKNVQRPLPSNRHSGGPQQQRNPQQNPPQNRNANAQGGNPQQGPRNDQSRNEPPKQEQPRNDQQRNDQPRQDQPRNEQQRPPQGQRNQPRPQQRHNGPQNQNRPQNRPVNKPQPEQKQPPVHPAAQPVAQPPKVEAPTPPTHQESAGGSKTNRKPPVRKAAASKTPTTPSAEKSAPAPKAEVKDTKAKAPARKPAAPKAESKTAAPKAEAKAPAAKTTRGKKPAAEKPATADSKTANNKEAAAPKTPKRKSTAKGQ